MLRKYFNISPQNSTDGECDLLRLVYNDFIWLVVANKILGHFLFFIGGRAAHQP